MELLGLADVLFNTYNASRGVPLVHIPRYLTRCLWTGCYMLFLSGCSNIVSGVLWLLSLLGFTHSLERVLPGFVMQMVGYDVAFLAWFYAVRQSAEVLFRTTCVAMDRVRGWEQWGVDMGGGGHVSAVARKPQRTTSMLGSSSEAEIILYPIRIMSRSLQTRQCTVF